MTAKEKLLKKVEQDRSQRGASAKELLQRKVEQDRAARAQVKEMPAPQSGMASIKYNGALLQNANKAPVGATGAFTRAEEGKRLRAERDKAEQELYTSGGQREYEDRLRAADAEWQNWWNANPDLHTEIGEKLTVGENIDYFSGRALKGLGSAAQGTIGFVDKLIGDDLAILGSLVDATTDGRTQLEKPIQEWADNALKTDILGAEKFGQGVEGSIAGAKPSAARDFIGGISESAGAMLPAIATGGAASAAGLGAGTTQALNYLVFGSGAAGNAAKEAINNGASADEAVQYGLYSGMLEVLSESMFAGITGMNPSGALDDILKRLTDNGTIKFLTNTIGEGVEEGIVTFLTPYIARATYDPQAASVTWEEMMQAISSGAAMSLLMNSAAAITSGSPEALISSTKGMTEQQVLQDKYGRVEEETVADVFRNGSVTPVQKPATPTQEEVKEPTAKERLLAAVEADKVKAEAAKAKDAEEEIPRMELKGIEDETEPDTQPDVQSAPAAKPAPTGTATERQRMQARAIGDMVEAGSAAKTSPAALGIENGGDIESITVLEEPLTKMFDFSEASEIAERAGYEPVYFSGMLQNANGGTSRWGIAGNKLYIQADSANYTAADIAKEAVERSTTNETISDRGRDERYAGLSAGGQTERVSQQGGSQTRRAAARANKAASYAAERASDYISTGSTEQTLKIIPAADYDGELKGIDKALRKMGAKKVYFTVGSIGIVNPATDESANVSGVYDSDSGVMMVRADSKIYTAQQLAMHEAFHYIADADPTVREDAYNRLLAEMSEDEMDELAARYQVAFGNIYGDNVDAYVDEILADAYAGINRENLGADRYRSTVNSAVMAAARPETEQRQTNGPNERYTFGGANANNANLAALRQAQEMEKQGVAAETIFQTTGWYIGADGKWRFEIDDSQMKYSRRGDLGFRERNKGYDRYRQLLQKAEDFMLGFSTEQLTEDEMQELTELRDVWSNTFRTDGKVSPDALPMTKLADYISHEELFRNYPQLRNTSLVFGELQDHARGQYDSEKNIITLREDLRHAPEDTIIHEIQHALQRAENFATGSTPEYFSQNKDAAIKPAYRAELEAAQAEVERWEQRFAYEWGENSVNLTLASQYAELNEQQYEEMGENPETLRDLETIEAIAEEGGWSDLLAGYAEAKAELSLKRASALRNRFDNYTAYRNTAGEIEARDAARRRTMTAEQRRATMPDVGNEDTVFAENAGYYAMSRNASYSERDESYLAAVERGDMETAQRIVDKVAKAAGYTVRAYHGTARGDRVGNVFLPERATSGPMAFFTDSKEIAENYSKSKQDTSMAYDPDYDRYETQFRIKAKDNDMPLYKAWGYLPFAARNRITKKAGQLREDWDGDNELMLDPDTNEANGGFQWQLKEARGNTIQALIEQWLNSGTLFNEESRFLDVLEMTGVTEEFRKIGMDSLYFKDPDAKHEKVYDTFLKIAKPFDTANVDEQFIADLEAWYEEQDQDQYVRENMESDLWDKNGIDAYDFAERLRSDLENNTTHAWTSIPDSVTDYLKSLGYDGIKDTGGKYSGDSHVVWIPFASAQIKSAEPVTYDDSGNVIPLSERFNQQNPDIRYSIEGADAERERVLAEREEARQRPVETVEPAATADEVVERKIAEAKGETAEENAPELLAAKLSNSRGDFTGSAALEKLGIKVVNSIGKYTNVKQLLGNARAGRSIARERKKAEIRLKVTAKEKNFARGIANGIYTESDIPEGWDKRTVMEMSEWYMAERNFGESYIDLLKQAITVDVDAATAQMFEGADESKVPPAIVLNHRTAQRNMLNIFGDKGKEINKWLFDPVNQNEAERLRFINRQFDQVRTFADQTGKQRALNKAEREMVQRVIEGRVVEDALAKLENRKDIEDAAYNLRYGEDIGDIGLEFGLTLEEQEIVESLVKWQDVQNQLEAMDKVIIYNAVDKYSALFDSYYEAINDFLAAHGYQPIGFIKGYVPHLQPEKNQTALQNVFQKLGLNTDVSSLPTSIAGLTGDYKPNKKWNPYFLHRNSTVTQFDIVEAFESYVSNMADVLYHADDIMRIRSAVKYFRRTYSPEEIRNSIEWAENLRTMPKDEKIAFLYDEGIITSGAGLSHADAKDMLNKYIEEQYGKIENTSKFNNLVTYLENYANILAGKQSIADRGSEYSLGRKILNAGNRLTRIFSRANVAGNLSSALNQSAQLPTILTENGLRNTSAAFKDIITGNLRKAGWAEDSDFLTGKRGVSFIVDTPGEMVINAFFKPLEIVDRLMSTMAVRGAYLDGIKQGMSHEAAMQYADKKAAAIMGDRTKGAKPLAFEAKNPISSMVHLFQIEVLNSWDHIVSDLPQDFRTIAAVQGKRKAAQAVAGVISKMLVYSFVLNRLAEKLYGGTPAPFDIFGLTANFIASGQELSTNAYLEALIDKVMLELFGMELFGSDEDERMQLSDGEFEWEAATEDLGYNISNEIPFLNNLSALLGLGDKTLPLPDVITPLVGVYEGIKNKSATEALDSALQLAGEILPAGRQMVKTYTGAKMIAQGGKMKGFGEDARLQYPVRRTAGNITQALLFGASGLQENQDFYASGRNALTTKETALWKTLVANGADEEEAYNAIYSTKGEDVKTYEKLLMMAAPLEWSNGLKYDAMAGVTSDSFGYKLNVLESNDIDASEYAEVTAEMYDLAAARIADLPEEDRPETVTISQEDAEKALKASNLSKQEKAIIWQMTNAGWSEKSNPFSNSIGKRVKAEYKEIKEQAEEEKRKEEEEDEIPRMQLRGLD